MVTMTASTYDTIVIGTGQAGVPLATRLAAAGERVAVIERGALGGTCVNVGCTPTKTMIASARAAHVARTAGRLGVHAREVQVDFPAIAARKDAIVERWRNGVARRLDDAGERLRLIRGIARFTGPREVDVGGERLSAGTVVINVGARPHMPELPGLAEVPFLDYAGALNLRQLPEHLAIIGGGYIGCELGQMFRRFGSRVTIIHRGSRLLDREERESSTAIEDVFRAEGIELRLSTNIERIRRDGGGASIAVDLAGANTAPVTASHLLVAVGRRPNTDDLDCDRAGIARDGHGFVVVDDGFATTVPGVYAIGDVTGGPQFTHTSWDEHRLLHDRLRGRSPAHGRTGRNIPSTIFTDPQVARIGPTEAELKRRGTPYEVATMPFASIARAIETDELAGITKVLLDPANERLIGATLVGADAGELIHIFVVLMEANASARAIVDAEFVHPTFAEGVQSLVMRLPRYALS